MQPHVFVNKSCRKAWSAGKLSRRVWSACVMYEYRVQSPVNKSINRTLSYSICSRLLLKYAWFFARFFLIGYRLFSCLLVIGLFTHAWSDVFSYKSGNINSIISLFQNLVLLIAESLLFKTNFFILLLDTLFSSGKMSPAAEELLMEKNWAVMDIEYITTSNTHRCIR